MAQCDESSDGVTDEDSSGEEGDYSSEAVDTYAE
jgi:hypothetical protein